MLQVSEMVKKSEEICRVPWPPIFDLDSTLLHEMATFATETASDPV